MVKITPDSPPEFSAERFTAGLRFCVVSAFPDVAECMSATAEGAVACACLCQPRARDHGSRANAIAAEAFRSLTQRNSVTSALQIEIHSTEKESFGPKGSLLQLATD